MRRASYWTMFLPVLLAGCHGTEPSTGPTPPLPVCDGLAQADTAGRVRLISGGDGCAPAGSALPRPVKVRVLGSGGEVTPGAVVHWAVTSGGGSFAVDSSVTDTAGVAEGDWTLGPATGGQFAIALVDGLADTARIHATAQGTMVVAAGGNNVARRYSSDLWVAGNYAYTGTWGFRTALGNVLYVWDVGGGVTLTDSITIPNSQTISDDEVSADGTELLVTAEYGTGSGLYLYSLTDPAHPALLDSAIIGGNGLHTGTFADIGGTRYIFTAKDPGAPALLIYRVQPDSTDPLILITTVGQPANYGIHDTFVRDGLAFVADWDSGLRIYDVGDGRLGGSPASPKLVGSIVTHADGNICNCVHNSWWYHDSAGAKRYLFVGQEGPGSVASSSSGDIHVVDVSDMTHPVEVAHYALAGAGTHNFWMDEQRGILYAAYYNAGVVALDVTGTLRGDLAAREIARAKIGGSGNTYTWGVMLANGSLWATDMLSGLWKVTVP